LRGWREIGRAGQPAVGEVMPLFWLVHEDDGVRRIWLQEASSLISARHGARRSPAAFMTSWFTARSSVRA
jgi:hypothetical protein